nr:Glutamate/gamma-aminobutyrate antiporter [Chlamydiota bacterium]
ISSLSFGTCVCSSAFCLLSAFTVMLYLIMYLWLLGADVRLRYKDPNRKRPYKIPGGYFGMWCVAGIGMLGSLFAIFVGFFPPVQLPFKLEFYVGFLGSGVILALILPQIIYGMRKPSWKRKAREHYNVK